MRQLTINILWVSMSFIYAIFMGMALGLGAMFIGNAFVMSVTGSLFSLAKLRFNWQIKWYYAGLLLAVLNTAVTLLLVLFFRDGNDDMSDLTQMLSLFYLLASYIVYFFVNTSMRWLFK